MILSCEPDDGSYRNVILSCELDDGSYRNVFLSCEPDFLMNPLTAPRTRRRRVQYVASIFISSSSRFENKMIYRDYFENNDPAKAYVQE